MQYFPVEVNEITWSNNGDLFFITTGSGTVEVFNFPQLTEKTVLPAHTANCYCIEMDPKGRYFALGSADSIVSLWDINELICIRTFTQIESPVRTLSFTYDGNFIASGVEDNFIEISHVDTGETVHKISCDGAMNSLAWHPKAFLLAYASDSTKHREEKHGDKHEGAVKIFGFKPSS